MADPPNPTDDQLLESFLDTMDVPGAMSGMEGMLGGEGGMLGPGSGLLQMHSEHEVQQQNHQQRQQAHLQQGNTGGPGGPQGPPQHPPADNVQQQQQQQGAGQQGTITLDQAQLQALYQAASQQGPGGGQNTGMQQQPATSEGGGKPGANSKRAREAANSEGDEGGPKLRASTRLRKKSGALPDGEVSDSKGPLIMPQQQQQSQQGLQQLQQQPGGQQPQPQQQVQVQQQQPQQSTPRGSVARMLPNAGRGPLLMHPDATQASPLDMMAAGAGALPRPSSRDNMSGGQPPGSISEPELKQAYCNSVQALKDYITVTNLLSYDISGKNLPEKLTADLKTLIHQISKVCLQAIKPDTPFVINVISKDYNSATTIDWELDKNHWIHVIGNLQLTDHQITAILRARQSHVERLVALYSERAMFSRQLFEIVGAGAAQANGRVSMEDQNMLGVLMRHGYLYCARNVVQTHNLLERLRDSLAKEQKAVMEVFLKVVYQVLSPVQAALFVVESFPYHCDVLALANVLSMACKDTNTMGAMNGEQSSMGAMGANRAMMPGGPSGSAMQMLGMPPPNDMNNGMGQRIMQGPGGMQFQGQSGMAMGNGAAGPRPDGLARLRTFLDTASHAGGMAQMGSGEVMQSMQSGGMQAMGSINGPGNNLGAGLQGAGSMGPGLQVGNGLGQGLQGSMGQGGNMQQLLGMQSSQQQQQQQQMLQGMNSQQQAFPQGLTVNGQTGMGGSMQNMGSMGIENGLMQMANGRGPSQNGMVQGGAGGSNPNQGNQKQLSAPADSLSMLLQPETQVPDDMQNGGMAAPRTGKQPNNGSAAGTPENYPSSPGGPNVGVRPSASNGGRSARPSGLNNPAWGMGQGMQGNGQFVQNMQGGDGNSGMFVTSGGGMTVPPAGRMSQPGVQQQAFNNVAGMSSGNGQNGEQQAQMMGQGNAPPQYRSSLSGMQSGNMQGGNMQGGSMQGGNKQQMMNTQPSGSMANGVAMNNMGGPSQQAQQQQMLSQAQSMQAQTSMHAGMLTSQDLNKGPGGVGGGAGGNFWSGDASAGQLQGGQGQQGTMLLQGMALQAPNQSQQPQQQQAQQMLQQNGMFVQMRQAGGMPAGTMLVGQAPNGGMSGLPNLPNVAVKVPGSGGDMGMWNVQGMHGMIAPAGIQIQGGMMLQRGAMQQQPQLQAQLQGAPMQQQQQQQGMGGPQGMAQLLKTGQGNMQGLPVMSVPQDGYNGGVQQGNPEASTAN